MSTKRKEQSISEDKDTDSKKIAISNDDQELKHDDDGNPYFELSLNRRISIRKWQNKVLIDIREYYEDKDGTQKPGKKGISLSIEQYESLKKLIPLLDSEVSKMK